MQAFAETAAVLAYAQRRFGGGRPAYLDLMWLLFGVAFMIKGPPGLLPLAAMAAFEWRSGGLSGLRALFRPAGLALFAAVAWMLLRSRAGLVLQAVGENPDAASDTRFI